MMLSYNNDMGVAHCNVRLTHRDSVYTHVLMHTILGITIDSGYGVWECLYMYNSQCICVAVCVSERTHLAGLTCMCMCVCLPC